MAGAVRNRGTTHPDGSAPRGPWGGAALGTDDGVGRGTPLAGAGIGCFGCLRRRGDVLETRRPGTPAWNRDDGHVGCRWRGDRLGLVELAGRGWKSRGVVARRRCNACYLHPPWPLPRVPGPRTSHGCPPRVDGPASGLRHRAPGRGGGGRGRGSLPRYWGLRCGGPWRPGTRRWADRVRAVFCR